MKRIENRLKTIQSRHYGLRHIPSAQIHFTDGKTKKLQTVDVSEAEITKLDEYYGKHFNKSKLESSYKEKSDNNYIELCSWKSCMMSKPLTFSISNKNDFEEKLMLKAKQDHNCTIFLSYL